MTNREYAEYLQSPKWKEIQKRRLEIDNYTCQMCGCTGTALNGLEVHHLSYRYLGREEERIYEDLVSLCHVCHKSIHRVMQRVTSADGRHGWADNRAIPKVHIFNLDGRLEYIEREE